MSGISDEEVIRRKLTIEGEGGTYDRKLADLTKLYINWCNTTHESDEERDAIFSKMMGMLDQAELGMVRTHRVYEMNVEEQESYGHLFEEIDEGIKQATDQIEQSKRELCEAKTVRKNKQEYDVLAKTIMKLPDRKETTRRLEKTSKDLAALIQKKEDIKAKGDLRVKQFSVMLSVMKDLQNTLEEDETKDAMETS